MIRAAILILFYSSVGIAQAEGTHVLLPAPIGVVAGGFGSMWSTELWVHNSGSNAVEVSPGPCRLPGPESCRVRIPAGATVQIPAAPPDVFSYQTLLLAGTGRELHFSLRTRDLTRSAFSGGTEIPVVRANEYLNGKAQLLNVPIDQSFRLTLRVFLEPPGPSRPGGDQVFTIRLFAMTGHPSPIDQRTITISTPGALPPVYTGYAVGFRVINDLVPRGPVDPPPISPVRVEIEPHRPDGPRYWAYLTITNNQTNHFTTITPQ